MWQGDRIDQLDNYSETEDHPLSFVAQVRREVANRVMTDWERRERDANGRCLTCGGPIGSASRMGMVCEPNPEMAVARQVTIEEALRPDSFFTASIATVGPRCHWCGLRPDVIAETPRPARHHRT